MNTEIEDSVAASLPTVLTAEAVEQMARVPLSSDIPGVEHRVLWHDHTASAGVLTVQAGHRLGAHTHRENHHHLWVLAGTAVIVGQDLGPGSYVHIPSGVEHDIDASTTPGCTVFYLYLHPGT